MNKHIAQKPSNTLRRQRGYSMVELGIGLIIVSGLAYAAFVAFQDNQDRIAKGSNINSITTIASDIKKKFGVTNRYGTVSTAVLVQSGTIPADMHLTATTAANSYGGTITGAPVTLTTTNDAVSLTWGAVPAAQCYDLVSGTEAVARRIIVGTTTVKALDGTLNTATLGTACTENASADVILAIGRN